MKKTLLYLLMICVAVSTVFGLAKVEFNYKQTQSFELAGGICYEAEDYVWCFTVDGIYRYDPSIDEIILYNGDVSLNAPNQGWMCVWDNINSRFLCSNSGNQIEYIPSTNTSSPTTLNLGGINFQSCASRPAPDDNEIYCWQGFYNPTLRKYDINTDTLTTIGVITYPEITQPYPNNYLWGWGGNCAFRNNNEYWCFGGYNDWESTHYAHYMRYIISTNTTIIGDLPEMVAFGQCRWYDDVAYCYGYENDYNNEPYGSDHIMYYDPNTDESGFLWYNVDLPYLYASEYGSTTTFNVNKDFIMGGYVLPTYDSSYDIYEVVFSPCNEQWVETNESCTGDPKIYLYEDAQHCLTYDNVPPQNGTVCKAGGYTPIHSASAITGLAFDIPVEMGRSYILYVGLIVVFMLYLLFKYLKDKNYF